MSEQTKKRRSEKATQRARVGRWLLLAALIVLAAVREHFDPFLSLFLDDLLFPKPAPERLYFSERLALDFYADTRPHIGKIDLLHKGAVLVADDRSLIEEAYGFGLPIVQSGEQGYVSRHAALERVDEYTVVKYYTLDTVDRWSQFLRVKYQRVPPLGTVAVTYTVQPPDTLTVTMDFTGLAAPWQAAYLMNEQGARAFTRYRDAEGIPTSGADVGIWQAAEAPFGCWEAPEHALRFCVGASPGQPGFVGRERYTQYNWVGLYTLSWSGIDIELTEPVATYTYTLRVEWLTDAP